MLHKYSQDQVYQSPESWNPEEKDWIPGQARNDEEKPTRGAHEK